MNENTLDLETDDLVDWFSERYEDPAESQSWVESECLWMVPAYDVEEVLSWYFPNVSEDLINSAAEIIQRDGCEWVCKAELE